MVLPLLFVVLVLQTTGLLGKMGEKPNFINEDEIKEKLKFVSEETPLYAVLVKAVAAEIDNIPVQYTMNGLAYFQIDRVSGDISMKTRWTLETSPPMTLLDITAVDAEEEERTITVTIQLNKFEGNDSQGLTTMRTTTVGVSSHCPTFDRAFYVLPAREDLPSGAHLERPLKVTDNDKSEVNRRFEVDLEENTGTFELSKFRDIAPADVFIRVIDADLLDYDSDRQFYQFKVSARDLGNPRCLKQVEVRVEVEDLNDEFPVFRQSSYTASVSELAAEATVVTGVKADDRDGGNFGSEGIRYKFLGQTTLFQVDAVSGQVTVARCSTPGIAPCLDYESQEAYNLTLQATDSTGAPSGNSATVQLLITISDAAETR